VERADVNWGKFTQKQIGVENFFLDGTPVSPSHADLVFGADEIQDTAVFMLQHLSNWWAGGVEGE
jgi:hypothetical protein